MAGRRRWVQALALLIGMLVFLAHVTTLNISVVFPDWLRLSLRDILAHFVMLATFALVYRLSFVGNAARANRASLYVCASWGAICECAQYFHPARDFNLWELGANILAPAIVIALFVVFRRK
jgi:VanZ family protein